MKRFLIFLSLSLFICTAFGETYSYFFIRDHSLLLGNDLKICVSDKEGKLLPPLYLTLDDEMKDKRVLILERYRFNENRNNNPNRFIKHTHIFLVDQNSQVTTDFSFSRDGFKVHDIDREKKLVCEEHYPLLVSNGQKIPLAMRVAYREGVIKPSNKVVITTMTGKKQEPSVTSFSLIVDEVNLNQFFFADQITEELQEL